MKHELVRESDYWFNDSRKLRDVECPGCGGINCLFKGFNSVGCRECLCYFGPEDFK